MTNQPTGERKSSPENRRKTGEANLARGAAHRFKPGQSGNPGDGPEQQGSRRRVAPNSHLVFLVMPRVERMRKALPTSWYNWL